jgi:primary-amine oxidase
MSGRYQLLKQEARTEDVPAHLDRDSRLSRLRIATSFVLVASAVALSIWYTASLLHHSQGVLSDDLVYPSADNGGALQRCPANVPLPAKPPASVNLWASLTIGETTEISQWLNMPEQGLNLTRADNATISDNVIYLIESYRPSKADALAYLAEPIDAMLPDRYARVTVHHGGIKLPLIRDYLVGPLPVSAKTSMRNLTNIYHREDIPYNARGYLVATEMSPLIQDVAPRLAEVTQVSYGRLSRR